MRKQSALFHLKCNWQAGACGAPIPAFRVWFARAGASGRRPYLARLGLSWLIASRQSAGTHLSAITQNSLQGGRLVYSTSISKLQPVGKRLPDSHVLIVEMETGFRVMG